MSLAGLMIAASFLVAVLLLGFGIHAVQRGAESRTAAVWGGLSIGVALLLILIDCTAFVVISQPVTVARPGGPRPFTRVP